MFEQSYEYAVIIFLDLSLSFSNGAIDLMSRVFANGPVDWCSIPGRVIAKTQKMVLDAILLNTQHKVEQSRERSSALP